MAPADRMVYLDSVALAKLKNLSLELRSLAVEGSMSGRHQSLWKGFSHDFAEHRPYAPGDELKTLDWKVYARKDRFYVRQYKAENILTTYLLLDCSGSMGYCADGRSPKWDHACRLAMALAYLILAKGDAVGLIPFNVEPLDGLPPRASFSQLEAIDSALAKRRPEGETDLGKVLERAGARVRRRSLVILISDLLSKPRHVIQVVKALRARRHELLVLQVLDPQEKDFRFEGYSLFDGLEGGPALYCDPTALRRAYVQQFEKGLRLYEASFHRSNIGYALFMTDRPWDSVLAQFLTRWR